MASRNNSLLQLKLEGVADLEAALRALADNKAIKRAIGKALLEAAEPVARDARARAPRKSGEMAETIDVSTTLSRRQRRGRGRAGPAEAVVFVGASPTGPAVLEEFGTTKRSTKTGKSTGSAPAHPFMRPAWEGKGPLILQTFGRVIWVTIDAEARRIARKQARLIRQAQADG